MKDKAWSGRFAAASDPRMESFNASIGFDSRLYPEDLALSRAHVRMLAARSLLSREDEKKILAGLDQVEADIEVEIKAGRAPWTDADEDIHMGLERRLVARIGEAGKRMHTARSRNDQVATATRLYLKKTILRQSGLLRDLLGALLDLSEAQRDTVMPGYTHLQAAQPVTLGFHLLAYWQMFRRDRERLQDGLKRLDYCPLGAGALAGVNYDVDRDDTAQQLGFAAPVENAMDAVSDRDWAIEYLAAAATLMMHLSRLAEELILWSSPGYRFVEMDDRFATGSSIMPNKKNPDALELLRGKTGRVYGALLGLLTVMKGLPLAYNKDMQEDKEGLFDVCDTVDACLGVITPLLQSCRWDSARMREATLSGYMEATDVADYLVGKGMAFRDAHHLVGKMVAELSSSGRIFAALTLADFQKHSPLFAADILERIKLENLLAAKKSSGSTSPDSVRTQLQTARSYLAKLNRHL